MPKIRCASIDCNWNSDANTCTYKSVIPLNDCDVTTLHGGREHFHRCMAYQKSERAKELENEVKKFLERHLS